MKDTHDKYLDSLKKLKQAGDGHWMTKEELIERVRREGLL